MGLLSSVYDEFNFEPSVEPEARFDLGESQDYDRSLHYLLNVDLLN